MPLVTASPKGVSNGDVITQFTDTTSTSSITYTYPSQQSALNIENSGERDIYVTVGSYTDQVIKADKKWEADVSFTSFSIRSDINSQEFIATAIVKNDMDLASISASLAQRMTFDVKNQTDFIQAFQAQKQSKPLLYQILQDRRFDVFIPQYGKYGAMYRFLKDVDDDFVKLSFADYSKMDNVTIYSDNKNYDSTTGTWSTTTAPNYYTNGVGNTFTVSFYGTGIDFLHFADTRGGVWEFSIDGTVVATISTHINAVPVDQLFINYGIRPVARNLKLDNHTLVGTFKGDDPSNPPSSGAGTSRGWVRYATSGLLSDYNYTTHIWSPNYQETKIKNMLDSGSVKEFAFSINDGDNDYEWIPEHYSKASVRSISQQIIIDGEIVTNFTKMNKWLNADTIIVKQKLIGYHPNAPTTDVCEITINQSITNSGIYVYGKIKWLKQTLISDGYAMMLPVLNGAASKLITSNLEVLDATKSDDTFEDIPNGTKCRSFMIGTTDGYISIVNILNLNKSLRDISDNTVKVQMQHRSDMQKIYPTVYDMKTVQIGEEYSFSCQYAVGKLEQAIDLFTV